MLEVLLVTLFSVESFMAQLEGNVLCTDTKTLPAYEMPFRFELHRITHLQEAMMIEIQPLILKF